MSKQVKTILITGGAGFVGSHLCDALIDRGHKILCLDNLYTGSKENISHLEHHPNFTFIKHDICEPIDLEVDEIYNLACPASPNHYQKNPIFTTRTCILGALNILELAKKNHAKILQASTSEVYGDPSVHPQKESYRGNVNPIGPRACYDEGKRCAETLFFDYHRSHDLDIKVVRIFNTYGPRMQREDGRVISNFIVQALHNKPLTIYGKGEQTRSFCYISDLIDGLILFMDSPYSGPLNLGNPSEFSIASLSSLILEMTGSASSIKYLPLPMDDPKIRCPDITAARELLKWDPKVALEQGLKNTIAYFQKKDSISTKNVIKQST